MYNKNWSLFRHTLYTGAEFGTSFEIILNVRGAASYT